MSVISDIPRPRPPPVEAPAPPAPLTVPKIWARDMYGAKLATLVTWLLVWLLVIPQGLDLQGKNGMPTGSDLTSKIMWAIVIVGGGHLFFKRLGRMKVFVRWVDRYLWLFLGLAAASILWSIQPSITLRRVVRLTTILMAVAAIATTAWSPRRFQDVLRSILTWLVVASVILVIVDPVDAIHSELNAELKDAWRGVTIGKNVLGSIASTAIILWLHAWLSKAQSGLKAFFFGGCAALCLIMSRSSTSVMATAFAVMFMLLLLRAPGSMRRYMPYLVGIFATIILVYCLAILRLVPGSEIVLSPVAAITGKDLTFTGRTAIWQVLNEHIKLNPWLGTGYGAYWIGATPESPSFEMLTRLFFYPTEGHNGYLDVINDLGAIGGMCLLGYFITYVRQSLWLMRFDRYQGGLYLTMLFRGFIADMSESHWFLVLSIDFLIMTMATMALARSSIQASLDSGARYRPAGKAGNARGGAH